jgi:predicted esterase
VAAKKGRLWIILLLFAAVGLLVTGAGCAKHEKKDNAETQTGAGGGGNDGPVPGSIGGPVGTGTVTIGDTYYLFYVPESIANVQNVPLVVFLHGTGDTPEWNFDEWQPAAELRGFIWIGVKSADFNGPYWSSDEIPTVMASISDALSQWNINPNRIYISGYSGGGGMMITTCTSPDGAVFAAMAGFCNPYDPWHLDFDSNPLKVPAYFATNADDYNYSAGPAWRDYFAGKGHVSTFTDETGRVSGHKYDARSALDAYDWMHSFSLP